MATLYFFRKGNVINFMRKLIYIIFKRKTDILSAILQILDKFYIRFTRKAITPSYSVYS